MSTKFSMALFIENGIVHEYAKVDHFLLDDFEEFKRKARVKAINEKINLLLVHFSNHFYNRRPWDLKF